MATLPTVNVGFIEIPFTTVESCHYRIIGLNTLTLSVAHTYHAQVTETSNIHYQDMNRMNNSSEVNNFDL